MAYFWDKHCFKVVFLEMSSVFLVNPYYYNNVTILNDAYCTYGTAQFKLDIYMLVTQISGLICRVTRELHSSKSLKYTFTCVSL